MQVKKKQSASQVAEEIMRNYGDYEIENLLQDSEESLKLGVWDYGGQHSDIFL